MTQLNLLDLDAPRRFQPYYVAWASSNGNTPDEQIAADSAKFGHFQGHNFMAWIGRQWREFDPHHNDHGHRDHEGFGRWLAERWPEVTQ